MCYIVCILCYVVYLLLYRVNLMLYSVYLMLFGCVPYVIWVCTSCYLCVYLKLYSVYHMLFSDLVGTIWYKVCTLCYICLLMLFSVWGQGQSPKVRCQEIPQVYSVCKRFLWSQICYYDNDRGLLSTRTEWNEKQTMDVPRCYLPFRFYFAFF